MNGFTKKLKKKVKTTWRPMKMITSQPKTSGVHQRQHKREVYSNPGLQKKEERSQIYNLTLHLKELEKEQQIKPKTSIRWETIKIRADINDIEIIKNSRTDPGVGSLKELTKLINL